MNKVILCEGVTDAILLSYYLEKCYGWKYSRKAPDNLAIRSTKNNESVNWYRNGDDCLLICAVGGKDNFANFFNKKLKAPIIDASAFEAICVITDRDNRRVEGIEKEINGIFSKISCKFTNNIWMENHYNDAFGMEKKIRSLLIVVPNEHQGALETVMLDAISENEYDANIVKKSEIFVKEMRSVASKYIMTDRLELKAHLSVTWAIQYPEKTFSLMDEQIRNVPWEESEILYKCFHMLEEI